jgi:uncharacterized protein YaeQ
MLVNSKGRAYTQRVEPRLALVEVQMPPEAFAEDWHPTPDDHMGIVPWIAAGFPDYLRVVWCILSCNNCNNKYFFKKKSLTALVEEIVLQPCCLKLRRLCKK